MLSRDEMIREIYLILAEYDFDDLISIGCPKDEYEPEARHIYNFIEKNPNFSRNQLVHMIQKVFMNLLMCPVDESYAVVIAMYIEDLLKIE